MPRKAPGKESKTKVKNLSKKNSSARTKSRKVPLDTAKISAWTEKTASVIMLVMIALFLFIAPFFRGLFFPRELLISQIAIFSLLVVWGCFRLFRRDSRLIETPLDLCLTILLLAYLVSFFVAVHKRDALEEVMKIASYLVIYLVVLDLSRYWQLFGRQADENLHEGDTGSKLPPGLNMILHMLLAAAVVITIASLGVAAGHWDFVGAYASNRIASPMGYANTAAAYLMAAYFLAVGLAPLAGRMWKPAYLAPATLMLITVVLTFSRGAWLLLPPLALLLVLASAPGERLRSFLYLIVTALAAIPAALLADPIFRSDTPPQAWYVIIPAIFAAAALGFLVELYLKQDSKFKFILATAATVLLLALFIIFVAAPALAPLHLEVAADEPQRARVVKQIIEGIEPGENYQLTLDILAEQTELAGAPQPEHIWGVKVLGGIPGYRDITLLDQRGNATSGWEEKEFSFETGLDTTRLEIQIYSEHPGSSLTARSVILSVGGKDQNLRFTLSRILPQRFYDRMFSYSRDRNLDRRLELFRDAIKIIKDYPILGAGGGGWAALYQSYQDQFYGSREVHNHYLQVWVEAGIFGFLAFLGIWVSLTASFIRNCLKGRASPRRWQFWTASFLPVAALGAHSAIDWNFSMAAVGIFLFALLAAGRSLDHYRWFGRQKTDKNQPVNGAVLTGVVAIIVGLFLLFYALTLLRGLDTTWRSQELLDRNNLKQAIIEMEKAIRLDPLRAENYHNLNVLLENQVPWVESSPDIQRVLFLSERAYELEAFNPSYVSRYGTLLLNYVDIEEGLAYIDQLMELRPFSESSYIQAVWARLRLIEFYMESGNRIEALRYIEGMHKAEETMSERYGDSGAVAFALGRAYYLLGNLAEALNYFEKVVEDDPSYVEAQNRITEILGGDQTP